MSARRRAREYVLKALYALEQGEQTPAEIAEAIIDQGGIDKKSMPFANRLFSQAADHVIEIDQYISRVAINWDLDRIAIVDKNILRIAITEVKYMPDIPIKVAINEAIELAKKYSTFESASFVNGILDKVMHDQIRQEKTANDDKPS